MGIMPGNIYSRGSVGVVGDDGHELIQVIEMRTGKVFDGDPFVYFGAENIFAPGRNAPPLTIEGLAKKLKAKA